MFINNGIIGNRKGCVLYMKAVSIIDRFVFFSDFTKIVTEDIPTLVKLFDGYKMNQRQEATPQGPVTVTAFSNKNYAVSFRVNRMDVEFANNPNQPTNESLGHALSEFAKVREAYSNLPGNRISYVGTSFIPNPKNEPLMDMVENIGLTDVFGQPTEFNFRLNTPVKIEREMCNAVLTVQQGSVQDPSKKNLPAIICVNDINTMPQDRTNRFELDELEEIYKAMMAKSIEKNEKVLALIEDAGMAS